MSKEPRRMEKNVRGSSKIIVYISVALIVAIVVISYILVANILKKGNEQKIANKNTTDSKQNTTNVIVTTTDKNESASQNTESASSSIGKTVEESEEENKEENKEEKEIENKENTSNEKNTREENTTTVNSSNTDKKVNEKKQEEKEISFVMPVEGEIIKGFAKDNLVYSETLQEWIVHQAIDIKSESRNVVKASAEGTVAAIKNDPRYGLTVIIEHGGGFKTVYSNLLTAEFVVEGEKVKQGQTLGTVGNSATFEISDEPHLHFEMLKDSAYVDPTIYIK